MWTFVKILVFFKIKSSSINGLVDFSCSCCKLYICPASNGSHKMGKESLSWKKEEINIGGGGNSNKT